MRYLVLLAMLALGCGSVDKAPIDFATLTEPPDLAQPIDLAAPSDMAAAVIDFAFPPCTMPQAGIYTEQVQYNWAPASGGASMFASSQSAVVIKNDGSFMRQSNAFAAPDRYHCSFATVDAMTCLAACCPNQPSSPTMYFDKGGWTFWAGGSCAFQASTGAQYIANVTDVEGYFSR